MELHRGAFVVAMDEESINANSELFGTVFAFVGRRAAERVTPELLQRLASIAQRLEQEPQPKEIYALAEEYLSAVIEAGSSPQLVSTLRRMRSLAVDNIFEVVPEAAEITRRGVLVMIDAIRAGDAQGVADEQMHMQRASAALVLKAFRDRGILEPTPPGSDGHA